eukprot:98880_1
MNYQRATGSYYTSTQTPQTQTQQHFTNGSTVSQPPHAAFVRSCSTSNLQMYAAQQQQSSYGHYAAHQTPNSHPHASRSTSNLRQLAYAHGNQPQVSMRMQPRAQTMAQSGIVLQSLSNAQTMQPTAMSSSASHIVSDNKSMNANLAQFSKYSQLQLQHALSQYPAWLQKEYMRRLQRQYEELYTVEDPKIHHWSAICPRQATVSPTPTPRAAKDTKYTYALSSYNLMGMLSESASEEPSSVEYLSESVSLSPSPYAYSARHACSPQKETKFSFDESMCKSPSPDTPIEPSEKSNSARATCFELLDCIPKEAPLMEDVEDDYAPHIAVRKMSGLSAASSETPTPRVDLISPVSSDQNEEMNAAYYAAAQHQQQQQQYQQAMQRWYQEQYKQEHARKQYKQHQYQQLLMQQAMQHQQYLIQQNKFVAQYMNKRQPQPSNPSATQAQVQYYAQNNNAQQRGYTTQPRSCA